MPPTSTQARLRLLCPGLVAPAAFLAGRAVPTPALDRLLARADAVAGGVSDPLETLAATFGVGAPVGRDLPSAPLALLADAPALARDGCWFHADPVHLRADRDRLLLFAGPGLGLRPDESAALVAAFNGHFAADGLHLVAPRPGTWFLRVAAVPQLRTQPLHVVAGRPLDALMPAGPDARVWNRWQNEAQMLFHQHPVNRARECRGRPLVSGFWTWGGGLLPRVSGGPGLTVADHPLARGLACAAGGGARALDDWSPDRLTRSSRAAGPEPASGEVLVFWDALWWPALTGDAEAWCAALAALEDLAAGVWAALAGGRLGLVTLDDGAGRSFRLTPGARYRIWRRGGGLRARLPQDRPGGAAGPLIE